ncbi:MAG: hypothetical protein INR65_18075 [Gluconacetobacter diazotrophicus]|nr:hypothetical protein [Gluconacetobacter diazotrophicus]
MRWINALERRFGQLAVPGLIRIVVVLNALVFLLATQSPALVDVLRLRPERVLHGEVWRLVSYIFIPQVTVGGQMSVIWVFFYLNFLWVLGEGLEQAWGSFKLNLYYLVGMLGTAFAVFCFHVPGSTGVYLNMSLFYAFATLFPNYPILLFFVIPVRVKWIALVSLAFLSLQLVVGESTDRLAILVALVNYLLFFGPTWLTYWREQGRTVTRRQEFQVSQHQASEETLHHCKVCGRTEVSSPDLEFRVAGDGEEYCVAHLPSRRAAA